MTDAVHPAMRNPGNEFPPPADQGRNERNTRLVILLTIVTMVVEIASGLAFNSMALLADGWHMASHAGALGITAFAYAFARRHAENPRFCFGTGKVGALGGFASAVVLAVVAAIMVWESVLRLVHPLPIGFNQAIGVAVLGLAVNLASVYILGHHGHDHSHGGAHDHHHDSSGHSRGHDHNIRAAYLHVLADALTSLTAIFALIAGKYFGWNWMDPIMGIVGSLVIAKWSYGLLRETGSMLLDHMDDSDTARRMIAALEREGGRVTDFHLWRVGPHHLSAVVVLEADPPREPEFYKELLDEEELVHLVIEVGAPPPKAGTSREFPDGRPSPG